MKKIDPHKPLTDKEWENLGPVMHGVAGLPKEAQQAVRNSIRGRPLKEITKKSVSIRLDIDVIEKFRAHGRGWQTEINNFLRTYPDDRP